MCTKTKYGKEKPSNEDIPLHFPDLATLETAQNCPAYMKILQRTKGGSVYIKELDSLQREIETISVSLKKRKRTVAEESKILEAYQEKDAKKNILEAQPEKDAKKNILEAQQEKDSKKNILEAQQGKDSKKKNICSQLKTTASEKRTHSVESKPLKKHKSGNSHGHVGRPKLKNSPVIKTESWSSDSPIDQKPLKADSPGRFWASLEPYFADITQDHVKFIEEWIESNEDREDYFEIPSLGRHFAHEWSQKEIEEEKKEGAKAIESDEKSNSSPSSPTEDDTDTEQMEENYEDAENPLAQRLLNALIDEKVIAGLEDTIDISDEFPEYEEVINIQPNSAPSPSIKKRKPKSLEERIKTELTEVGILESEKQENNRTDCSDGNLLDELKEAQTSLRMMMEHNLGKKLLLMKAAKEEIHIQDIRKKLNIVDAEIMDMLRKNPKKKTISKKEKENAVRLLNDRKVCKEQLKALMS